MHPKRPKYKQLKEQFERAEKNAYDKQLSFYHTDKWYYNTHHGPNSYATGTVILKVVQKELPD